MNKRRKKRNVKKIERKKGLKIPFELYNKSLRSMKDKYMYKANIYNCNAKSQKFENMRFRSSNFTKAKFKGTTFKGVDFIFSNLKKSIYKNCKFEDVIFFGTNMKDCRFHNCEFVNVHFINIDKEKIVFDNEFDINVKFINIYPNINLIEGLENTLYKLFLNNRISQYNVLNVSKVKINKWMISILLEEFSEEELIQGFNKLTSNKNSQSNRFFFTYHSFRDFLYKYLQKNR